MRDVDLLKLKKKGLSIGHAARALRVPVPTLRDWMNAGKLSGVGKTAGGHRWITREGLLKFAEERGIEHLTENRRRHFRIPVNKLRVCLEVRCSKTGALLAQGEGRLRDLSRGGFRSDRMRWITPVAPVCGAEVRFRVPKGKLKGVSGTARIAWNLDNRRERGATLGAALKRIGHGTALWTSLAD